jgi:gas vesicle protein
MRDREESSANTKLTYLLIGGGIGAIIALLFAPKSGVELREDIADVTKKGIEKGKESAAQIQEKAGEYYEVTRERASELYSTAQDRAGELYQSAHDKAEDFADRAKETAARSTNPFSAAIEAGKKAYVDEKRRTEVSGMKERPTYPIEDDVDILKLPTDFNDTKES